MRSFVIVVFSALLLFIAAIAVLHCGGGSGQGDYCEGNGDCAGQLVCVDNICIEPQTGDCDPPCDPAVEACKDGTCVVIADANDKDRDGYQSAQDCDDYDRLIHPGARELCDGVDNNCDGATDEGCGECDEGDSRTCGSDLGACLAGSQECVGGRWEACNDTGPQPERCDGLDNDCDGMTDEVCPCTDGAQEPCSTDEGECVAGVQICSEGAWPGCLDGELPREEVCDSLDNDCDALTDEGFGVGEDCRGEGVCGDGQTECADLNSVRCSTDPDGSQDGSAAEQCNGLDDDCDGETDEDFPVGDACQGLGACGEGVRECAGADQTRCSTDPGGSADASTAEICNAVDDDCDGETDEDFPLGDACAGVGECGAGQVECADDGSTRCSTHPGGSADASGPEACNGLDDDCDGQTDEGLSGAETCDGVDNDCDGLTDADDGDLVLVLCPLQEGVCFGARYQAVECEGAQWNDSCLTADYGAGYEFQTELSCDDQDNDCDGFTDEDIAPRTCTVVVDGVGTCTGHESCDGHGNWIGCDAPTPTVEVCDGVDNDCDGQTDEGFGCGPAPVGGGCNGVGNCGVGVCECLGTGDGAMCSTDPGGSADQSAPEQCNELDDDCDGETDEPFSIGTPCDGVGACGAGLRECATTTTTRCSTDVGGSQDQSEPEICDGQDNDCDGSADEGFRCGTVILGGTCDGVGACGMGHCECRGDASGAICSTDVGGSQDQSQPEACNGQDDDCDGIADGPSEPMQVLALCEEQRGVCAGKRHASNQCLGSTWAPCESAQYGSSYQQGNEATCDGLDNDCDGAWDENWDQDGDNYTTCGTVVSTGAASPGGLPDCCDVDTDGDDDSTRYYPGNTQWFGGNYPCSSYADAFDFNCNGTHEYQYPQQLAQCEYDFVLQTCTLTQEGWMLSSLPSCGGTEYWATDCLKLGIGSCIPLPSEERWVRCH